MFFLIVIFLFALYQSIYILFNDKTSIFLKGISIIVFIYVIYLGSYRNTYLPFLGPTVLPASLLKEADEKPKANNIHAKLFVNMPDGTKVVYWAAQPSDKVFETPFEAYNEFANAGVAIIKNKQAILHVDCPASYYVPGGKKLSPHVHYRIVYPNGMLGSVKTLYVQCSASAHTNK
jgi:hypothetical protein